MYQTTDLQVKSNFSIVMIFFAMSTALISCFIKLEFIGGFKFILQFNWNFTVGMLNGNRFRTLGTSLGNILTTQHPRKTKFVFHYAWLLTTVKLNIHYSEISINSISPYKFKFNVTKYFSKGKVWTKTWNQSCRHCEKKS